jgi:hypothetical protein
MESLLLSCGALSTPSMRGLIPALSAHETHPKLIAARIFRWEDSKFRELPRQIDAEASRSAGAARYGVQGGWNAPNESDRALGSLLIWHLFCSCRRARISQLLDFAARQIRPIFEVDKDLHDGRWILYSQIDDMSGDIMLVDHFQ